MSKKDILSTLLIARQNLQSILFGLCLFTGGLAKADPLMFGDFTYMVDGSPGEGFWINITDYPDLAVGPVVIPAVIDEKPVRNINSEAFNNCALITSVVIPENVTFIGGDAFTSCTSLASVSLPQSLEVIEPFAFYNCDSLIHLTIPENVFSIGSRAFDECNTLGEAYFLGNAPGDIGEDIFGTNTLMKVNFLASKTGYTTPRWRSKPNFIGYLTFARTPLTMWLLINQFPESQDLASDPNGDGVNLLMAYALNLDPKLNLSNSLPSPVFSPTQMSMTFYAGRTDISYSVVASDGLVSWSATGVSLTSLNAQKMRTATVAISGPKKFMRLVVNR